MDEYRFVQDKLTVDDVCNFSMAYAELERATLLEAAKLAPDGLDEVLYNVCRF